MPRTTPLIMLSLAATGLLALAGCASTDADKTAVDQANTAAPGNPYAQLAQSVIGDWTLAALNGVPLADLPTDGVRETPSLRIEPDGRTSGAAGVNRWFSSIDMSQLAMGAFSFAPAGSTMMAGPEQAMTLERNYLSALAEVRRIDPAAIIDGQLRLLNTDGNEVLKFARNR